MEQGEKKCMNGAERLRKFREKKKNDPNYQKNENLRIENLRKTRVRNMSPGQCRSYRAAAAERKRRSRAKHHQNQPSTSGSSSTSLTPKEQTPVRKRPFRTPQALGKTVRRAMRTLPYSPSKKTAVVSGIASRLGLKLEKQMDSSLKDTQSDVDKMVRLFYFRSDIVYTAPGVKDEMVVWENGKKQRLRKYYLTMFLREAYALYTSSTEGGPALVSFSKFCSLRPQNVLLLKNTPADQCKCKQHENFRMMLQGVNIQYDGQWWKTILCSDENLNSDCWKGECTTCQKGNTFLPNFDSGVNVIWKEWMKDNNTERLKKVSHEGCGGELMEKIIEALPIFQEHVRVKRIQAAAFESDKVANARVLQVDFAMAYSCEYQNEVQSALWSRESVQLFTAALFCKGKCQTYLICSDTKDKGKDTIYAFMVLLWDNIFKGDEAECNMINVIYSDGPSSEFKNKFMAKMLYLLSLRYVPGEWSWKYFGTSHGKGVVDGIGGRSKSLVRQKSMSKSDTVLIQSSTDFASIASQLMSSTRVLLLNEDDILKKVAEDQPWEDVQNINGIQKMHVMSVTNGKVLLWHTDADNKSEPNITVTYSKLVGPSSSDSISSLNFQAGDWCLVRYDKLLYAGEILSVGDSEVEVSVMVPSGNYWKWPQKPDVLMYSVENIIKKITPPSVVNNRGQFQFDL